MGKLRHADLSQEQLETMRRDGVRNVRALAIACGIDPNRLKDIRFGPCPFDESKTTVTYVFEPALTEREEDRFSAAIDRVVRLLGGRPIIRPGRA